MGACHSSATSGMNGGGSAGTNSSGPIKSVSEAKDLQELSNFLYDNYDIVVKQDTLQGVEFESVKMAAEGITFMMDEFPEAAANFHELKGGITSDRTLAAASFRGVISINNDKFATKDKINDIYERNVKTKYHPEGSTANQITVHEAGHILERALIDKHINDPMGGIWDGVAKAQAWDKSTCASKVISEAARNAKKTPGGKGKTINSLISDVSGYASKNRSEALAECVADYVANKGKAKPLSQEVWKVLKRELG